MSKLLPKIWRDLDQKALDDAYDQSVYALNLPQIIGRMAENSQLMRKRLGEPIVFDYGQLPIQKLYYYPAKVPNHPIVIFVRGGAWRQKHAPDVAFPAEHFVDAGIGYAIFDYIGVEETGGDLNPLLDQVLAALSWLARHAAELGGDTGRLFVAGFSSGAHLAGVAMTQDWTALGFEANPYCGAILTSGMYDLHPVRLSKRSEYVNFPEEVEQRMSAARHLEKFDVPTLLAYGLYETPEFQRQTAEFAAVLREYGRPVRLVIEPWCNHVEMMEALGHPYSSIGQAALKFVQSENPRLHIGGSG